MRLIDKFERKLERWAAATWSSVRKPPHEPLEVVEMLRRECDENALILGRGRTLVPNHFTIELPHESHRQLAAHSDTLEPELTAQIRRYAAERRYHFTGPVAVCLHPHPEGVRSRYRVHSRIAPDRAPAPHNSETQALPLPEAPPAR